MFFDFNFSIIPIPTDSFKSLSEASNFYFQRLDDFGAQQKGTFQLDLISYTSSLLKRIFSIFH